jgi:hypothetical protein
MIFRERNLTIRNSIRDRIHLVEFSDTRELLRKRSRLIDKVEYNAGEGLRSLCYQVQRSEWDRNGRRILNGSKAKHNLNKSSVNWKEASESLTVSLVAVHGKVLAGETLNWACLVFCMSQVPQRNRPPCQRRIQHAACILERSMRERNLEKGQWALTRNNVFSHPTSNYFLSVASLIDHALHALHSNVVPVFCGCSPNYWNGMC